MYIPELLPQAIQVAEVDTSMTDEATELVGVPKP